MDQLRLLWILTLCLVTISGLTALDPLTEVKFSSPVQRALYVKMEIINRIFNTSLLNPATDEYQTTYKEVSDLLESIYNCPNHTKCPTNKFYRGVVAMTFSSGSVITKATMIFNTSSINPSIVYFLFKQNANKVEPHILQLNLNFTTPDKVNVTTVSPTNTSTTTSPTTTTPAKTTTSLTATTPTTTKSTSATTIIQTETTSTPMTTSTTTTLAVPTTASPVPATTLYYSVKSETMHTTSGSTPITTITKTPTSTTASTSPALTPSTTTNQFPTTASSSIPNTSSDDGGQNPTQDPTMNKTTTLNPHSKHTAASSGKPSDSPTSGGGSNGGRPDSVPGWAIALLVLAAAILLLLIIIFIIMLIQWCGKKTESDHVDTTEDPYYSEKKQPPQEPLSVQSPQSPVTQKPVSTAVIVGDTPRKNRTGFYAVNP